MSEVVDYCELLEIEFLKLWELYGVGCDKSRLANCIDSFWGEIGDKIFQNDNSVIADTLQNCKIPYHDVFTLQKIIGKYIQLCDRFGVSPKIYKISELLKINPQTIYNWNKSNKSNDVIFSLTKQEALEDYKGVIYIDSKCNINTVNLNNNRYIQELFKDSVSLLRIDIYKIIQQSANAYNDNLLDSSSVGAVARANNDEFIGKLWDSKRVQARIDATTNAIVSRDALKGYLSARNDNYIPSLDDEES